MPTEIGSSTSSRTVLRSRSPTSAAGPSSLSLPVRSRNASSSDTPCTTGVKRRKISKMRFDSVEYLRIEPGRKTPWGQRRRASTVGMAECTPNTRAS